MSSETQDTSSPDAQLIERVRSGDDVAFAELFERHHAAALRYARSIAGPSHADDLVADAFARLLIALRRGKGPDVSFRPYLFTTVRRLWADTVQAEVRYDLVDDLNHFDGTDESLVSDEGVAHERIATAFQALPERWREALWLAEVEGYANGEIARRLEIKPNAVAALTFRAREALRREYLAQGLPAPTEAACVRTYEFLPAYVRGTLTDRRAKLTADHIATCARCTVTASDLATINKNLGIALPVLAAVGAIELRMGDGSPEKAGPSAVRPWLLRVTAAILLLVCTVAVIWWAEASPAPTPTAPDAPTPSLEVVDLGAVRPTPTKGPKAPAAATSTVPAPVPAASPPPPVAVPIPSYTPATVTGISGGGSSPTATATAITSP